MALCVGRADSGGLSGAALAGDRGRCIGSGGCTGAERAGGLHRQLPALPCHRLGGSGEGIMGPDLLRPMPAATYFTEDGLRALIRSPAAVRSWPGQRMPAFGAETVGDSQINAVIAYLRYLAVRPK
jgi:cytochrome c1